MRNVAEVTNAIAKYRDKCKVEVENPGMFEANNPRSVYFYDVIQQGGYEATFKDPAVEDREYWVIGPSDHDPHWVWRGYGAEYRALCWENCGAFYAAMISDVNLAMFQQEVETKGDS